MTPERRPSCEARRIRFHLLWFLFSVVYLLFVERKEEGKGVIHIFPGSIKANIKLFVIIPTTIFRGRLEVARALRSRRSIADLSVFITTMRWPRAVRYTMGPVVHCLGWSVLLFLL